MGCNGIFLASIATEEYESIASALIQMHATDTNVDAKAFANDLEKMFSSMKASIKLCLGLIMLCFKQGPFDCAFSETVYENHVFN